MKVLIFITIVILVEYCCADSQLCSPCLPPCFPDFTGHINGCRKCVCPFTPEPCVRIEVCKRPCFAVTDDKGCQTCFCPPIKPCVRMAVCKRPCFAVTDYKGCQTCFCPPPKPVCPLVEACPGGCRWIVDGCTYCWCPPILPASSMSGSL